MLVLLHPTNEKERGKFSTQLLHRTLRPCANGMLVFQIKRKKKYSPCACLEASPSPVMKPATSFKSTLRPLVGYHRVHPSVHHGAIKWSGRRCKVLVVDASFGTQTRHWVDQMASGPGARESQILPSPTQHQIFAGRTEVISPIIDFSYDRRCTQPEYLGAGTKWDRSKCTKRACLRLEPWSWGRSPGTTRRCRSSAGATDEAPPRPPS